VGERRAVGASAMKRPFGVNNTHNLTYFMYILASMEMFFKFRLNCTRLILNHIELIEIDEFL